MFVHWCQLKFSVFCVVRNTPGQQLVTFTSSSNLSSEHAAKDSMSKVLCSKYYIFMPNLHMQKINETVVVQ